MNYNWAVFVYTMMLMISTCFVFDKCMERFSTGISYLLSGLFAVCGMIPAYYIHSWWGY